MQCQCMKICLYICRYFLVVVEKALLWLTHSWLVFLFYTSNIIMSHWQSFLVFGPWHFIHCFQFPKVIISRLFPCLCLLLLILSLVCLLFTLAYQLESWKLDIHGNVLWYPTIVCSNLNCRESCYCYDSVSYCSMCILLE